MTSRTVGRAPRPLVECVPQRVGKRVERRLGAIGPGQRLDRTVDAHVAKGPTEYVIGDVDEKVRSGFEELGSHPDFLAALAREQNCVGHGGFDP